MAGEGDSCNVIPFCSVNLPPYWSSLFVEVLRLLTAKPTPQDSGLFNLAGQIKYSFCSKALSLALCSCKTVAAYTSSNKGDTLLMSWRKKTLFTVLCETWVTHWASSKEKSMMDNKTFVVGGVFFCLAETTLSRYLFLIASEFFKTLYEDWAIIIPHHQ